MSTLFNYFVDDFPLEQYSLPVFINDRKRGLQMISECIAIISLIMFPVTEVYLSMKRRSKSDEAMIDDKGSLKNIWKSVLAGIILASICRAIWRLTPTLNSVELNAFVTLFVLGGMAFKWNAINTLGRHFTVNVTILDDHQLIETGIYKWIRHPAYTGVLISFFGCGLFAGNVYSIVAILTPIAWSLSKRIKIEEALLANAFGQTYEDYRSRTWKLFPYIW